MVSHFHLNSMTFLIGQTWLTDVERSLVTHLYEAAKAGLYWDSLSRLRGKDPNYDFVICNIVSKIKQYNLTAVFEALRDQATDIHSDVPDRKNADIQSEPAQG